MRILFLYILVFFSSAGFSQSGKLAPGQQELIDTLDISFDALTINDGLSQGMIQAIIQDRYGYMWFATKDGLNRFDGYTFAAFRHDPENPQSIGESTITALHEDRSGRIWVGLPSGLDMFDRNTESFVHIPLDVRQSNFGSVTFIRSDRNGDLWIGATLSMFKITFDGEISGTKIPSHKVEVFHDSYSSVEEDQLGRIWMSSGTKTLMIEPQHMKPDSVHPISNFDPDPEYGGNKGCVFVEDTIRHKLYGICLQGIVEVDINSLGYRFIYKLPAQSNWLICDTPRIDRDGSIWLSTLQGLFRFYPSLKKMTLIRSSDPELREMVQTLKCTFIDKNFSVWFGTAGYGLLKYDLRRERMNRIKDSSILGMSGGHDGKVLTSRYGKFLSAFDPALRKYFLDEPEATFINLPELKGREGQAYGDASFQDTDGTYWLAINGLVHYDAKTKKIERHCPMSDALSGYPAESDIFPIVPCHDGYIWCGSDSALLRFDRVEKKFTAYRFPIKPVKDPYLFVQVIYQDPQGIVWAGTLKGLLRFDPNSGTWKHYPHDPNNDKSISNNIVFTIEPDQKNQRILWIGTNGGGFNKFDKESGEVKRFGTAHGLPNEVVYGILSDEDGLLWMSTNKGIARFNPQSETFRNFNSGDGLQSDEFNRYAYCKQADGTMFFGGVNGFNYFNPKEMVEDSSEVTVRITDVLLMNKPIAFGKENSLLDRPSYLCDFLEIPYRINMVTFRFATMEFSNIERHRYQYRLIGFNPEWLESETGNEVSYTNLDPGTYTFQVRGDNADGIWNRSYASYTLVVLPPWWRTWWFYGLCFCAIAGLVLWYLRDQRNKRLKLETQVLDRTSELRNEKNRSESLLNNILPEEVGKELKSKGYVEARHYQQVTILFTDFVIAGDDRIKFSPTELIEDIDFCFKAFDDILERYKIEKIKTIGDTYMAAGGLPNPDLAPAEVVVLAALEMQQFMLEHRRQRVAVGKPFFTMRVGIHSGPVVAGIVGVKKFAYDIWGDTVNIASRMESAGEPGEVNISAHTYEVIKSSRVLNFHQRGKINVKGKGEMEMFFARKN